MFILEITKEQVKAAAGFVTIWETDDGVSRVSLEVNSPSDTDAEYVGKASQLSKFACLHFGGLGNNGARITFDQSGVVKKVEAV